MSEERRSGRDTRGSDAAAAEAVWTYGDYDAVARRLAPGAEALAAAVRRRAGRGHGRRALDVAAGTGNAAVVLARDGWAVLATDLVPAMVRRGADRTAVEAPDVGWAVADLAAHPVDDSSCDLVASTFGLVFAADPGAAAVEAARVLVPGGLLALTAWPAVGLVADLTRAVDAALRRAGTRAAPGSSRAVPVPRWDASSWADPLEVGALLRRTGFADVRVARSRLAWDFGSREDLRTFLGEQSPAHAGAARLLGQGAGEALVDELVRLHAPWTDRGGRVRATCELAVVTARRRG